MSAVLAASGVDHGGRDVDADHGCGAPGEEVVDVGVDHGAAGEFEDVGVGEEGLDDGPLNWRVIGP